MRIFGLFFSRLTGAVEDLTIHRGQGIVSACEAAGSIMHKTLSYERVQVVEYEDQPRDVVAFSRADLQATAVRADLNLSVGTRV